MKRFLYLAPLLLFAVAAAWFALGLRTDPGASPSAMIGKPAPEFDLPGLDGGDGLTGDALRGEVALLNVFASWCAPCAIEHPVLMAIAQEEGVPLYGLNWKDDRDDAKAFLDRLGDPYRAIGSDRAGRVAIDFGVTGAPETFVIDADGRIRHRHVGVLTDEFWRRDVKPIVDALQAEGS